MALGITDFVNAFTAVVAPIPVAFGKRNRPVNSAPPQFSIYPLGESYSGTQGPGMSAPARALHTRNVRIEIHSWGLDYGPAEDLNKAAITVIRGIMGGASYQLGDATWIDPLNEDYGAILVLQVTLIMALPAATLPLTSGGASPDDAFTTTKIVNPNNFKPDPTGVVVGDGKLDWGEG